MVPVAPGPGWQVPEVARGCWGRECTSQEEHQVKGRTSGVRAAPLPGPEDGMTLRKGTDWHPCATAPAVGQGGGGSLRGQQRPFMSPSPPLGPYAAQVIEPRLTITPQPATVLVPVPACCVWVLSELPHPLHRAGNRVLCLAPSSAQVTAHKMSLTSALDECRVLPQLPFGPAEAPGWFLEVPSPQPLVGLGSARHEQIFLPLLLLSPRNITGSGTPPRSHPRSCSDLTFAIVCWLVFLPPPLAIRSPKPLAAEQGGGTAEEPCPWAVLHTGSWGGPHIEMEFFAPARPSPRPQGRAGCARAVCAGSIAS